MSISKETQRQTETKHQYWFFNQVYHIGSLVTWVYFNVLLLRASDQDVSTVILSNGVHQTGIMLGYLLSSRWFSALGYLGSFRLTMAANALVSVLAFLTIDNILAVFLILSLFRGIGNGFYWNALHIYTIRELKGSNRSETLGVLYSLQSILGVVLPVLIGALVSSSGYPIIFILGAAIYLLGLLYPWSYNKKPRDIFKLTDMRKLSRRTGFKAKTFNTITSEFFSSMRAMVLLVLPFLLIGDELGLGIFLSAIGLVGAVVSYVARDDAWNLRIKEAYIAGGLIGLATTGLVFAWTVPALAMRQVLVRMSLGGFTPVAQDLSYSNTELILGDFQDEYTIEMQQFNELWMWIARMSSLLVFIILFFVVEIPQESLLKFLLIVTVFREVWIIFWDTRLNNSLKKGKPTTSRNVTAPLDLRRRRGYV